MKLDKNTYIVAIVFIFVGAFSRLIDRLPNFSAMEALALFGGAYFVSRAVSIIVPIISMYLSDLVINNTVARAFFPDHNGFVFFSDYMIYNFIAMAFIALMGSVLLKKVNTPRVLGSALAASCIFFVITNFGVWAGGSMYSKDLTGLVACYTAAIPFFNNSLISSVLFSVVLFGSFELYRRYAAGKLNLAVQKK